MSDQVSASLDLCSTEGFILESKAVKVSLGEGRPLELVNMELVTSVTLKCDVRGPR